MKAQEAMEYLTTYGWAIVVIVLVIGVLSVFFSDIRNFEYCKFRGNNIVCEDFVVYKAKNSIGKEVNYINLRFIYNGVEAIYITDLACVKKGEDYTKRLLGNAELGIKKVYHSGEEGTIKGLSCGINEGNKFEGEVVIKYKPLNNPDIENIYIGDIKSSVAYVS